MAFETEICDLCLILQRDKKYLDLYRSHIPHISIYRDKVFPFSRIKVCVDPTNCSIFEYILFKNRLFTIHTLQQKYILSFEVMDSKKKLAILNLEKSCTICCPLNFSQLTVSPLLNPPGSTLFDQKHMKIFLTYVVTLPL